MDATELPPAASSMTLRDHIDQLIKTAPRPLGLADLKKLLQQRNVPVKGPKGFKDIDIERTANDAVADGAAFAHPAANGKPKFWHTAYVIPPTPAELVAKTVREKVAALGDDAVVADSKLGKPTGKKLTDETAKAFDDTLAELIARGELHRHGEKYGKKVPPPPKPTPVQATVETVRKKVAELSDSQVVAEGKLGKPTGKKETAETTAAFETVLKELIANETLFQHPGGKYGKTKPLPPPPPAKWYEKAPHKAKFTSLVTAANKLFEVGGVTVDEVLAALREKLGSPAPTVAHTPQPPVSHAPASPPFAAPPADLRTVLKQAYDDLCEFVEFRDKLVELPRLYREATKRMPGLTPEVFQAELWEMGKERVLELHVINEERSAAHPELAIRRHDSLYYYARWN